MFEAPERINRGGESRVKINLRPALIRWAATRNPLLAVYRRRGYRAAICRISPRCERLRQTTPFPSLPLQVQEGARHSANQPTSGEGRRSAATFLPRRRGGLLPPASNSTPREKLDPRIPLPRIIIAPRANEQVGVTRGEEEEEEEGTGYRSREAQPPSFLREGGNFRDEKGGRTGDGGGWRIEDYCANRFRRFRLLEGSR